MILESVGLAGRDSCHINQRCQKYRYSIFYWSVVRQNLSDANSTFLSDLQNDSEEDCYTERDLNAELPFQDDSHFKKFEIRFRNKESKDDV